MGHFKGSIKGSSKGNFKKHYKNIHKEKEESVMSGTCFFGKRDRNESMLRGFSVQHWPTSCLYRARAGQEGGVIIFDNHQLACQQPAQTQTSGPWWKLLKISDSPPPCLAWLPVVTSFWQNITVPSTRDRSIKGFDQWNVRKM